MKTKNLLTNFIVLLTITLSAQTMANGQKEIVIEAEGFHEIGMGTMLNPFSTTVSRAETKAKKNLRKRCKDEFDGKIVGVISTELVRYDSGIMGAVVVARGICEIDN